jgi:NCS1 family nucleobase:cation symporter-1
VPAWTLVAQVVDVGFAAGEAMAVVASANALVLAPMIANGAAGTKYGIGFPVYCRSAFGVRGASVATFARAIVGCGWFGIQTNVGGQALATMTRAMGFAANGTVLPWLGLSVEALVCYLTFLAAQLWVVYHGIESIRRVEEYAAPVLI